MAWQKNYREYQDHGYSRPNYRNNMNSEYNRNIEHRPNYRTNMSSEYNRNMEYIYQSVGSDYRNRDRASYQNGGLMDMLMHDPTPLETTPHDSVNRPRSRKQGATVRHPLDLIDTNIPHYDRNSHRDSSYRNNSEISSNASDAGTEKRKSSFFSLRRTSSLANSVASRKSNKSNKSLRSNATITSTRSTGSYIRKNSGNFDGGNNARRRKSSSLSRKASTASNRDKIIADFYKELEQLEEMSSSSSEDEEETKPKNKKLEKLETENSKRRVEEYVMKHSVAAGPVEMEEDEGFDTNSETKSRYSASSDVRRRSYDKYRMEEEVFETNNTSPKNLQNSTNSRPVSLKHKRVTSEHDGKFPSCSDETRLCNQNIPYKETPTKKMESTKLHLRDLKYGPKNQAIDPYENFLNHKDVTRKMNDLIVDMNDNDIDQNNRNKSNKSKKARSQTLTSNYNKSTKNNTLAMYDKDLSGSDSSLSTDSAHGSTRSVSTVSSCSNLDKFSPRIHRASAPQNIYPRKNTTSPRKTRHKSLPSTFNHAQKTSFCFKGITCKIQHDAPRTYKAFAHAGCLGLVIAGPSAHKCQM